MFRESARRVSLALFLVQLQFILIIINYSTVIHSLSISPPSASSSKNSLVVNRNYLTQQQNGQLQQLLQQQQQQQPATTLPPQVMTTMNIYSQDSLAQQVSASVNSINDQRLNYGDEHNNNSDDNSVPQATINNHSRNNQAVARPPQYVDVSALVGRNLSSTSSLLQQNSPTASLASNGASGLTAKSRSGLPECATQQVCNAIFVRMNYTQKLCECSSNYNWKCSHNLDPQDGHTIELTRKFDKRIYTQIKTCEPLREVRACKSPTDWTLLALQSERSGKAHYVVVCKCPTWAQLEGPYTHNHPPYANIPGIRVYGMLCAHQTARSSAQTYATYNPALSIYPEFPWSEALNVLNTTNLLSTLDSH